MDARRLSLLVIGLSFALAAHAAKRPVCRYGKIPAPSSFNWRRQLAAEGGSYSVLPQADVCRFRFEDGAPHLEIGRATPAHAIAQARMRFHYWKLMRSALVSAGLDEATAGKVAYRNYLADNAERGAMERWEKVRRTLVDSYRERLAAGGAQAKLALEELARKADRLKAEMARAESELADEATRDGDEAAYERHIAARNHWSRVKLTEFLGWNEEPPSRALRTHFSTFYTDLRRQAIESSLQARRYTPAVHQFYLQQMSFTDETNPFHATVETLIDAAAGVLHEAGVEFRRETIQGHLVLVILAGKRAQLDRFAAAIRRMEKGVRVIYDPFALENPHHHSGAGALFDSTARLLFLPHDVIGEGHLGAFTLHEVMHGFSDAEWHRGVVNAFRGTVWQVPGGPKKSGIYETAMAIEELAANTHTLAYRAIELRRTLQASPAVGPDELRDTFWSAYQHARNCDRLGSHGARVFRAAIEEMKKHPAAFQALSGESPLTGKVATDGYLQAGGYHIRLTLALGDKALDPQAARAAFEKRIEEMAGYAESLRDTARSLVWDMKDVYFDVRLAGDDARYRPLIEARLPRWLALAERTRDGLVAPMSRDENASGDD